MAKSHHHPGFNEVLHRENKAAGIHIKPSHKGLLHEKLHVPQGENIPESKLEEARHSKSAAERKEAVFAENFGHKK